MGAAFYDLPSVVVKHARFKGMCTLRVGVKIRHEGKAAICERKTLGIDVRENTDEIEVVRPRGQKRLLADDDEIGFNGHG